MSVYFFVFILALILNHFLHDRTPKQYRWNLFWTFLPLFIFGAIRVDFGNDYITYKATFEEINAAANFVVDNNMHEEVGYQLLNFILPSYRSILLLTSLLMCFSYGVFIYHNVPQKYVWLFLILLCLNPEKNVYGTLVGIRNGLVISGFLLSTAILQKRKIIQFVAISLLMMTIHTSAVLFLPIAYVCGINREFTRKEMLVWVGGIVFCLSLGISSLVNMAIPFIADNFERYEVYLQSEKQRGILIVVTNLFFVVIFIVYMMKNSRILLPKQRSIMRIGLLYLCCAFLGILSLRTSNFYNLFFIASLVIIISNGSFNEFIKFILIVLAILVSCYSTFLVWMGSQWWDHATYHSLWGNW
ncbi:EpsG family protein [Parabacteroides sp.]